ncbi:MAG: hypothetical protein HC813_00185 [Planctomycetes bacterium]|nr:hypothetical protein [Planctomycetota bacterium]
MGGPSRRSRTGIASPTRTARSTCPRRSSRKSSAKAARGSGATTDEERAKAEKGLFPWKGRWVSRQFRESQIRKELAAREVRIAQMKERQLWRNHIHVKTRTFEFRTTLPDDIFAEFQDLFETYFDFFSKFWRIRPSTRFGKPVIHIYHDEETYYQVSGAPRGAVGYYVPTTRQLHFYYDREHRDFAIDVMFHEGNHMLTHMVNEKVHYPAWLNEGMAEYFGASHWDPETKTMELGGLQSGRLAALITYIENGQWMGIETLMKSGATLELYSWGWSLCHFLMTDARYSDKFKRYFVAVGKGDLVKQRAGGPLGQRTVDATRRCAPSRVSCG